MAFVDTATLFEAVGCYYYVHVKILVHVSPRKNFKEALKRENYMNYENNTYKKSVITSFRCTNVIRRKNTRQIEVMISICANLSPRKCLSEKNNFWKTSKQVCLVLFFLILKYTRLSAKLLPTFHPSSGTKILVWKKLLRRTDFWLSPGECQFQAFSWLIEQSLHRCCCFIWTWELFAKNQPLCVIHSNEMVQQFCSVCGEC